jgi:hypothetical protein
LYNVGTAGTGGILNRWSNDYWNDNVTGGAASKRWAYYYRPAEYVIETAGTASYPTPIVITIPAIQPLAIEQSEVDESTPAPKKRRFFLDE